MPQQTPQAIAPGRTVTVWEVEDDAALAGTVAEYLTLRGCEVRAFGSADAARQALLARRPDLVLLDWNLPDGGGDALCRWLRQRWPGLPVIFLTVRDDARDIVAGLEAGGDDYLTKPFLLEVLAGRIRAVLRRTLTVTVKRLREKLSDPPCLKTVRSLGYRMEDTE